MVKLEDIIEVGKGPAVVCGIYLDLPYGQGFYIHGRDLVVKKVNSQGVQVPEDEKQGRVLDQSPSPFPVKTLAVDGEDEGHHGEEKKEVPELVDDDALRSRMHLGGMGKIGDERAYKSRDNHRCVLL